MATIEVGSPELLKAVQQLGPEEFDSFLERALSLRKRPVGQKLSATESRLIKQINRGLPESVCSRFANLVQKRDKKRLTHDELVELLKLTDEFETLDTERATALLELANLRGIPLRTLMKQMGIKAAPLHG